MLNHAPVLGTIFGLGLLLFGTWRKSEELKKTALGVFVVITLLTVPVYLTGEPAENLVKALPGVSKPIMEQHEEAATAAFIGIIVLGLAAAGGLLLFNKNQKLPTWFCSAMLAAALIVSGIMAWTANVGGQIRHTEIRGNGNQARLAGTGDRN